MDLILKRGCVASHLTAEREILEEGQESKLNVHMCKPTYLYCHAICQGMEPSERKLITQMSIVSESHARNGVITMLFSHLGLRLPCHSLFVYYPLSI